MEGQVSNQPLDDWQQLEKEFNLSTEDEEKMDEGNNAENRQNSPLPNSPLSQVGIANTPPMSPIQSPITSPIPYNSTLRKPTRPRQVYDGRNRIKSIIKTVHIKRPVAKYSKPKTIFNQVTQTKYQSPLKRNAIRRDTHMDALINENLELKKKLRDLSEKFQAKKKETIAKNIKVYQGTRFKKVTFKNKVTLGTGVLAAVIKSFCPETPFVMSKTTLPMWSEVVPSSFDNDVIIELGFVEAQDCTLDMDDIKSRIDKALLAVSIPKSISFSLLPYAQNAEFDTRVKNINTYLRALAKTNPKYSTDDTIKKLTEKYTGEPFFHQRDDYIVPEFNYVQYLFNKMNESDGGQ